MNERFVQRNWNSVILCVDVQVDTSLRRRWRIVVDCGLNLAFVFVRKLRLHSYDCIAANTLVRRITSHLLPHQTESHQYFLPFRHLRLLVGKQEWIEDPKVISSVLDSLSFYAAAAPGGNRQEDQSRLSEARPRM